ncbi:MULTISPECIES: GrpB family protein [Bacillus]|uniref:GrpB family protein n=1 Tax=Bacillus pseudomycoides TaxID=64104 RepID=A0A1Y3MIB4_9BACI|nr:MULTISPECIES: GrpB family protein [Bacillus cereus group]EOP73495.1 hypothetical protein KOW_00905 [Bacillus cereus VDM006]EOQ08428.1 hypothetical protein KOY_02641 [Bacillus cereus VDM021]OOG92817.1 hypothetical protein BTH41_04839 [Bacillus mycoides]MDF2085446.1 GrpB family protein [Bacillus pseudomycoides]OUM50189.1 GrpB family protein [Bacillus pseudomycoides]
MAEKTRIIEIMSYNPEWKMEFKKIKIMIESYIGDLILRIEHVGSTSVEGLAAKPIIDILRDYLSANEAVRKEYEELKYRLAENYRYNIDGYCEAKTDFVKGILNKTLYIN